MSFISFFDIFTKQIIHVEYNEPLIAMQRGQQIVFSQTIEQTCQ